MADRAVARADLMSLRKAAPAAIATIALMLSACDNSTPAPVAEAPVAPAEAAPVAATPAVNEPAPIAIDPAALTHEQGHAWVFQTNVNPAERQLRVFEDGKELGPGGAMHEDVRKRGLGAYSHWDAGEWGFRVYFSASDNSDPSTNGRKYELR